MYKIYNWFNIFAAVSDSCVRFCVIFNGLNLKRSASPCVTFAPNYFPSASVCPSGIELTVGFILWLLCAIFVCGFSLLLGGFGGC
jgi:hypothetical protein